MWLNQGIQNPKGTKFGIPILIFLCRVRFEGSMFLLVATEGETGN